MDNNRHMKKLRLLIILPLQLILSAQICLANTSQEQKKVIIIINQKPVDLSQMSTRLKEAAALAAECKKHASESMEKNISCRDAMTIVNEQSPNFIKLDEYIDKKNHNKLSITQVYHVKKIYISIGQLIKDLNDAKEISKNQL